MSKKEEIKQLKKTLKEMDQTAGGHARTGIPQLDRPREELKKRIKELERGY